MRSVCSFVQYLFIYLSSGVLDTLPGVGDIKVIKHSLSS